MAERLLAELKARAPDLRAVRARLDGHATAEGTRAQRDTYFVVASGRLKLREVQGRPAELIYYERPDVAAVKASRVVIAPVGDGGAVRAVLEAALGVRARVRKVREVWRWEGAQVHLDVVDGLGTFVEFEESVHDPAALPAATAHLQRLFAALGLPADALCAGSYAEMLAALTP